MLSNHETLLIVIVLGAFALIFSNRVRSDIVALLVLLALGLTGVVTPQEALSGFSRPVIVTIIGLFILSHGLEDTGVVQKLADHLRELGANSERRLILIFMGAGMLLSLFMNNIAAGAVLLPAAVQVARDSRVSPSKLLMPLSFGTLVGGMATYFTTANIILSGVLTEQNQDGLGMMSFIPTGALICLVALIYMLTIGRRLLPVRESVGQNISPSSLSRSLYETYQLEERLWELRVLPGSQLVNVPLRQSRIGEHLGLTVMAIWRGHEAILTPEPNEVIKADDYLLILGREDRVVQLYDWGLLLGRENGTGLLHDIDVDLTEVIIPPRSSAIGKTLTELRFRNKYGLTTVALWREGRSFRTDVGKFRLQVGDALLMVGPAKRIKNLAQDRDFMVITSSHTAQPPSPHKAPIALAIMAAVLVAAIFEIVPTEQAMLLGSVAMVLTGCLDMDEAYRSIEWRVVFLIAGMLPVSIAMVNSGLAARIGEWIVTTFSAFGALGLIAALFAFTTLLTQVVAGQVSALIVGPIAVSAALALGVNPQAVAVAVAVACSTAFLTPIAHPVNVLMMGPGGYRPPDFLRVGLGMTVLTFIMTMVAMAVFWGIR